MLKETDQSSVLMVNDRSDRAAVILRAPSRTFDDGVQERVRLLRPVGRESMGERGTRHIQLAEGYRS